MDPLVHTREQRMVETVDFNRLIYSEEGEDCPIGRKGMAIVLLNWQDMIYID